MKKDMRSTRNAGFPEATAKNPKANYRAVTYMSLEPELIKLAKS